MNLTWDPDSQAVLRLDPAPSPESVPQVVLLFFAAVLLFSSFKLLSAGDGDEDDDADLSQNFIVKTCKCVACLARAPQLP